jgi:hypothetical protein
MLISVVNHTNNRLKDEDVQVAARAVNRQIAHDFEPYWNIAAELRLEGPATKRPSEGVSAGVARRCRAVRLGRAGS